MFAIIRVTGFRDCEESGARGLRARGLPSVASWL